MGAERWLQFKSPKETLRAKQYLDALGPEVIVGSMRCWLEWTGKQKLEIGYSLASPGADDLSGFIMREIARRFTVTRVGADSVGWYPDREWQVTEIRQKYGDYATWAAWIADYRPEFSWRWEPYGPEAIERMVAAGTTDKQLQEIKAWSAKNQREITALGAKVAAAFTVLDVKDQNP